MRAVQNRVPAGFSYPPFFLLLFGLAACLQPLLAQAKSAPKRRPAAKAASSTAKSAPAKTIAADSAVLASVTLNGSKRFTAQQVMAFLKIAPGMAVTPETMKQLHERLVNCGHFASVAYRYEYDGSPASQYRLTFDVADITPAYTMQFEELPLKDAELVKTIQGADPFVSDRLTPTNPVLNRAVAALAPVLGDKVTVVARVMSDRAGEPYVLFRPNYPRATVATVSFLGNKTLPLPELNNKLAAVAVGVTYDEARFQEILQLQIKPMYEVRGLVRAKFTKVEVKPAEDVKGLAITVTVDEGEPYKLASVTAVGVPNPEELVKAGQFKLDEVANFGLFFEGVERMRAALRQSGYLKAEAKAARSYDDADKAVHAIVTVTPGPLYTFGTLQIKGLDITSEPVIRKLWGLEQGKPYREGYAERVAKRILDEGLFDDLETIQPIIVFDEARHIAHVTLQFVAKKAAVRKPKA